ncbi:MAG: lipid-binding SYLF domain-containing protein [Bdellovibrionales bacterium]|nr:lipid-binding SYLF domain-containing protein [Bdellovibrionales bacterium]
MNIRNQVGLVVVAAGLLGSVKGVTAEDLQKDDQYQRGRMGEQAADTQERDANTILSKAADTFKQLTEQRDVPQETKQSAKCIAVFPEVTKAAVLIGGRSGDGVAACRNQQGKWSQVAFLDLRGASLGAQLGATQTSLVLFLQDQQAANKLQQGKLEFGADASAVFGSQAAGIDIGTADVFALAEEDGMFAGATLNGVQIEADESKAQAFYGREMKTPALLSSFDQEVKEQSAKQFLQAVRQTLEQSAAGEQA